VAVAQRLFALLGADRQRLLTRPDVTIPAVQLLEQLPLQPMVTAARVIASLRTTKPTAAKAIAALQAAGILHETTGRKRDRVYAYRAYLEALTRDEPPLATSAPERTRFRPVRRSARRQG
jgi:cell filamentation protein, protein adenylyltransferase